MPWLIASPGHQQPWYWLCSIYWSLPFWGRIYHVLSAKSDLFQLSYRSLEVQADTHKYRIVTTTPHGGRRIELHLSISTLLIDWSWVQTWNIRVTGLFCHEAPRHNTRHRRTVNMDFFSWDLFHFGGHVCTLECTRYVKHSKMWEWS